MKPIYAILFAAALSVSILSCEEKSSAEKVHDHMHEAGDDVKDTANDAGDALKKETKKTTVNGGDAH